MCHWAYEVRGDQLLKQRLDAKIQEDRNRFSGANKRSPFEYVRHYIGRLGHHIRAPRFLLKCISQDQDCIDRILDCFEVKGVPMPPAIPKPKADSHTTCEGILTRLLPGSGMDSNLRMLYANAMDEMDRKHDILIRILVQYQSKRFKPKPHAEVQVLEHFAARERHFVSRDRLLPPASRPAFAASFTSVSTPTSLSSQNHTRMCTPTGHQ